MPMGVELPNAYPRDALAMHQVMNLSHNNQWQYSLGLCTGRRHYTQSNNNS